MVRFIFYVVIPAEEIIGIKLLMALWSLESRTYDDYFELTYLIIKY